MKKLLSHPLALIVITIFFGLVMASMRRSAQKSEVASQNVDALQSQIDQLSGQLEQERQLLQDHSSPLAQEKALRNELLLQRPGEYVIQIPDEILTARSAGETEVKSPWEEWLKLLF